MGSGDPPDIAYADTNDFAIAPQQAWKGTLADVSDIVEPLKDKYTKTALLSAYLYNNADKKRSYYAVPLKQQALHDFYWRPLVEKAGYKDSDIPRRVGRLLEVLARRAGQAAQEGHARLCAGLPDVDGRHRQLLHVQPVPAGLWRRDRQARRHAQCRRPKTREAAVKTLTFLTNAFKDGYVPPSAVNWGDPDNNVAFFSKQIIMTCNATISIPVAKFDDKQLYEHDIVTRGQPLAPDGKEMTSLVAIKVAMIPKAAKHVDLAKAFMKFFVTPDNLNHYLVAARGRWLPVMPEIVKNDPYWTDPKDPHRPVAVKQEIEGPTAALADGVQPCLRAGQRRGGLGQGRGRRDHQRQDPRAGGRRRLQTDQGDLCRATSRRQVIGRGRGDRSGRGGGPPAPRRRRGAARRLLGRGGVLTAEGLWGGDLRPPLYRRLRALRRLSGPLRPLARQRARPATYAVQRPDLLRTSGTPSCSWSSASTSRCSWRCCCPAISSRPVAG